MKRSNSAILYRKAFTGDPSACFLMIEIWWIIWSNWNNSLVKLALLLPIWPSIIFLVPLYWRLGAMLTIWCSLSNLPTGFDWIVFFKVIWFSVQIIIKGRYSILKQSTQFEALFDCGATWCTKQISNSWFTNRSVHSVIHVIFFCPSDGIMNKHYFTIICYNKSSSIRGRLFK